MAHVLLKLGEHLGHRLRARNPYVNAVLDLEAGGFACVLDMVHQFPR